MRMYKVIEIIGLDQNGYATFRNVDTSPDLEQPRQLRILSQKLN